MAKWDAKGQLETLRWWCGVLKKSSAAKDESAGPGDMDELIRAYLARIEAGDASATADYAQWIRSVNTKVAATFCREYGPFISHPFTRIQTIRSSSRYALVVRGLAIAMVARTGEHRSELACRRRAQPSRGRPGFSYVAAHQLQNQMVAGSVEITKDNVMVQYVYGSGDLITDPETPPTGFKQDLRLCDIIACRISQQRGFPRFEPYWQTDRRDIAIAQIIASCGSMATAWGAGRIRRTRSWVVSMRFSIRSTSTGSTIRRQRRTWRRAAPSFPSRARASASSCRCRRFRSAQTGRRFTTRR